MSDAGDKKAGFTEEADVYNDYTYDRNGNMISDNNKGISAIIYNILNLPNYVSKSSGESILYFYDATGRKLSQVVRNASGAQTKLTDYHGKYIYENDTLKFANTEEGRVIMTGAEPEYQYHLKDHLGNVRMTFTTKEEVETSKATFETVNATLEAGQFKYYSEAVTINSEIFDHTNAGTTYYSTRLNGTPTERYGLAKSLSVMPGDTINAQVFVKYLDPTTPETPALAAFFAAIGDGSAPLGTFKDGGLAGSTGGLLAPFWALFAEEPENDNEDAPKAYLNWLIFDRNYTLKDGGALQISTAAAEHGQDSLHEELTKQLVIKEAGYVYVYLSNDNYEINEEIVEVYFDDFKVEHVKSPVISSQDFYPFGLTFNSYSRENSLNNQYQYNGKELQDELSLGWLDYGARMYMSDIGRWGVVDPMSETSRRWSVYNYAYDNPIRFIDPDGMQADDFGNQTYSGFAEVDPPKKGEPGKLSGPDAGVNEKGEPYAHVAKGEVKIKDKDGEFKAETTVLGGKMDTKSAEFGKDGLSTGVIDANVTTIGVKVETQLGSDQNNLTLGFSVDGPSADGKAGVGYTKKDGLDAGLGGTAQMAKQGVQLSVTIGGHQIGINGAVYEGAIGAKVSVTGNRSGFGANVRAAFLGGLGLGVFYNKK